METRIPTHIWVEAKIRELSDVCVPVYVLQRGDKMGGLVLVKIVDGQGQAALFRQQRDLDGSMGWFEQKMPEKQADETINKEKDFDSDLWVIEVEERALINPFSEHTS